MLRVFEAQAPPKQTASDTIAVLCSRLNSSTLLEDRRAAILGLRSFAKEYPASVSSGALAGLISSLAGDDEDVETVKPALETILNLFEPLESSPEASEDIALWLADQFTQKQDNFAILLNLIESSAFFSRLYSLQIISSIAQARPAKTQQCILYAPLATTRLVASLRDPDAAIRSAATVLLAELSVSSPELQQLVAYEGAFDHIFNNIEDDGGILFSSIVLQDSLSLLANLVRHNSSNQALFRTSGCVARLHRMLSKKPLEDGIESFSNLVPMVGIQQRDRNIWGLLVVLRLFLVEGGIGTHENQIIFMNGEILTEVVQIAFGPDVGNRVRAEALNTCADMIRGNGPIQEKFAEIPVIPFAFLPGQTGPTLTPVTATSLQKPSQESQLSVEALLNLTLNSVPLEMFDIRLAAANCIIAFFHNHAAIKRHFLQRAIDGHLSGNDEVANVISTLLAGTFLGSNAETTTRRGVDLYRVWFASMILFNLIHQDPEMKAILQAVKEGNSEEGEEEVSLIQAVSAMLISILQRDSVIGLERDAMAYLMLLCSWLYENPDAVNDLLEEASIIQVLTVHVTRPVMSTPPSTETIVLKGLCATLLGIIYDFSRKDSPVPRRQLQSMLHKGLGRDKYQEVLYDFRHEPHLKDFEVLPQDLLASPAPGVPPDVFFYPSFVEFLKDRFPRITKAIDRDPGKEFHAFTEEGVDRDILDELRQQLKVASEGLQEAQEQILDLEARLRQESADRKRENDAAQLQYSQLQQALDEDLRTQLATQQREFEVQILRLESAHDEAVAKLKATLENVANLQQHALKAESMAKQSSSAREEVSRQLAVCEEEKRRAMADVIKRDREVKEARDRAEKLQLELDTERGRGRDLEARVGTLITEARSAKEEANRIGQERECLRTEIERVKKQTEDQKQELRGEIERLRVEVKTLVSQVEAAKKALEEEVRNNETTRREISTKESELSSRAKELAQLKQEFAELSDKLRTTEEARAKLDKEVSEGQAKVDRIRSECASEIEKAVKQAVEAAVKETEGKAASREAVLERELRALKEQLGSKDVEMKKLKTDREKEASELKARLNKLESDKKANEQGPKQGQQQQKKNNKNNKEAENGVDVAVQRKLEAELKAAQAKAKEELEAAQQEARAELEKLQGQVKELREKMEKAEEGRKTAQTELDDILLVLTDMEEKKDKYKGKLKAMGEEVSDDDGDEDGDEE